MAKAPAYKRSAGVREMIDNSTLDNELGSVLRDIADLLKGLAGGITTAISFLGGNWQLLVVGAVALVILSKRL
jgi:hypothetical protein